MASKEILTDLKNKIKALEEEVSNLKTINNGVQQKADSFITLFNESQLCYQSLDKDAKFLEVNRTLLKTLGYEKEEILNKTFPEIIAPYHQEDFRKNFNSFINNGLLNEVYLDIIKKSGDIIQIELNGIIIYDDKKRFKSTHCVFKSISGNSIVEQDLLDSKNKYLDVFESIDDGVVYAHMNGIITDVNSNFCKITGIKYGNIVDRNYVDVINDQVPVRYGKDLKKHILLAISGKSPDIFEMNVRNKIYSFSIFISATRRSVTCTIRDVTEIKKYQDALKLNEDRLLLINSQLPVILWATNKDLVFVSSQGAGLSKLNLVQNELVENKVSLWDYFQSNDPEFTPIKTHINALKGEKAEFTFPWEDSLWQTKVSPLYDDNKKIIGTLAVAWDISDRVKIENELKDSEDRYKLLFDNLNDGMLMNQLEESGRFSKYIEVNKTACEQLGYTRDEMLNLSVHDINLEKNLDYFKAIFKELKHNKRSVFVAKRKTKSGLIKDFEINSHLFKYKGNTVVLSITRDITEKLKIEKELSWQRVLIESTFNAIDDSLIITDKNRNIILCNKGALKNFKYSRKELIGKSAKLIYSTNEEFIKQGELRFNENAPTSYDKLFQLKYKDKEGRIFTGETFGSKLMSDSGEWLGNMALMRDITERENFTNELIEAKEKAEESDKLKSAFLANMSHEIRTPMNGIIGFAELLSSKSIASEKRDKFIHIIVQSSKQLLTLVNDIIDISKIEAGQVELNIEKFNVFNFIQQIYAFYKPLATKKGVDLLLNCSADYSLVIISSDLLKLKQVLNNLLSNALKYTEEGTIEIGFSQEDKHVIIYVRDTGIGISREYLQIIFERFRQADISKTDKYGGTGLGLAISKAFIKSLGGEIWAESSEKGSTFYIKLKV